MNASYKIPESVLVVIYTADLMVLLMERADQPGFWQSVTGSKDVPDEPLIETVIREVKEETGITIEYKSFSVPSAPIKKDGTHSVPCKNLHDWQLSNIYEIYPIWRHRYAPGVKKNTEHVFGLLVPYDISVTLCPREHLDYLWLPYHEASDKCFSPSNAEAILHLSAYARNSS
jgi:dihydroneopterin triphosphate diphosphatase